VQVGNGHKNPQFLYAIHMLGRFYYFHFGNRLSITQ
jgi:hypothetical protein